MASPSVLRDLFRWLSPAALSACFALLIWALSLGPGAPGARAQAFELEGDGGPAQLAHLSFPSSVAALPDGEFVVADTGNRAVRLVDAAGDISTLAGGPSQLAAPLVRPTGVAIADNGDVVIADPGTQTVWRVSLSGMAVRVAGTGTAGFSGDGGPATSARLDDPVAVSVTPGGAILIADRDNDRIRRVALDGTIQTVAGGAPLPENGAAAGTLPAGLSLQAATDATLDAPSGVAATPDGGFLVADTGHNVIRRFSYGAIVTVAGSGDPGFQGDRAQAIASSLAAPSGVAATPDGTFVVADHDNQVVRQVGRTGVIDTVLGTGDVGAPRPVEPANKVDLAWPSDVDALASGDLLVADTGADVILRLSAAGTSQVVAGFATRRTPTQPLQSTIDLRLRSGIVHDTGSIAPRGCHLRLDYFTSKDATAAFRMGSHNGPRLARTITAPSGSLELPRVVNRARFSIFFRARRSTTKEQSGEDRVMITVNRRCR